MTDDLWGDHFLTYTNVESLHCTPETNAIVYVSDRSIKKKKKKDVQRTTGTTILGIFTRDLELLTSCLQTWPKKEKVPRRGIRHCSGKTHKFCLN